MADAVTVRPATADDLPAIAALVERCGLRDVAVDYSDYTPPVFVAEADGRVVGFLHALLGRPASVVMDLAVDPAFQHQGVGRQLLATLEETMRDLGLTTWVTVVANKRGRVQAAVEQWGALPRADAKTYVRTM